MILKIGGWVFLQKRKIPRPEILSMMDSHRSHHFTVTPTYSHKNQLTHTHTCTGSSHIDTHARKYIFTFTHAWAYRQTNSFVLLSFCSHFLIASVWISACRPPGPQSTESKLLGVKSDTRTSVCWGRQTTDGKTRTWLQSCTQSAVSAGLACRPLKTSKTRHPKAGTGEESGNRKGQSQGKVARARTAHQHCHPERKGQRDTEKRRRRACKIFQRDHVHVQTRRQTTIEWIIRFIRLQWNTRDKVVFYGQCEKVGKGRNAFKLSLILCLDWIFHNNTLSSRPFIGN